MILNSKSVNDGYNVIIVIYELMGHFALRAVDVIISICFASRVLVTGDDLPNF